MYFDIRCWVKNISKVNNVKADSDCSPKRLRTGCYLGQKIQGSKGEDSRKK